MIIWSGFGILAALLPVLGYVVVAGLVQAVAGTGYIGHHSWPGALGTLMGAAGVWVLSVKLSEPERHTVFYIPLKYLSVLFAVVAVLMLLIKTDSSL
jgi:hypothetical protein